MSIIKISDFTAQDHLLGYGQGTTFSTTLFLQPRTDETIILDFQGIKHAASAGQALRDHGGQDLCGA